MVCLTASETANFVLYTNVSFENHVSHTRLHTNHCTIQITFNSKALVKATYACDCGLAWGQHYKLFMFLQKLLRMMCRKQLSH